MTNSGYSNSLTQEIYSKVSTLELPIPSSTGTKIIFQQLEPYKDKVRRIHTDGFILEEDASQLPLINCTEDASKTLKALKFEKEGKCYVKNANQVSWL